MDYRDTINNTIDSILETVDPESLQGLTLRQLVKVWTEYRFGTADEDYNQEWVDRYKRRGYYAFISHMDGMSKKTWFAFHQLWAEVNAGRV